MPKKYICQYCGRECNQGNMCGSCRYRYELVHKLKQMKPPKSTKKAREKIVIFENGEQR